MDNGNMILPPFRATDYKQEVHAQVDWVFIKIFTVNPAACVADPSGFCSDLDPTKMSGSGSLIIKIDLILNSKCFPSFLKLVIQSLFCQNPHWFVLFTFSFCIMNILYLKKNKKISKNIYLNY